MVKDIVKYISLTLFAIFEFIDIILFLPCILIRDYRYSREHRNDECNLLGSVRSDLTLIGPEERYVRNHRGRWIALPDYILYRHRPIVYAWVDKFSVKIQKLRIKLFPFPENR